MFTQNQRCFFHVDGHKVETLTIMSSIYNHPHHAREQ